jgi:hypothetical protein
MDDPDFIVSIAGLAAAGGAAAGAASGLYSGCVVMFSCEGKVMYWENTRRWGEKEQGALCVRGATASSATSADSQFQLVGASPGYRLVPLNDQVKNLYFRDKAKAIFGNPDDENTETSRRAMLTVSAAASGAPDLPASFPASLRARTVVARVQYRHYKRDENFELSFDGSDPSDPKFVKCVPVGQGKNWSMTFLTLTAACWLVLLKDPANGKMPAVCGLPSNHAEAAKYMSLPGFAQACENVDAPTRETGFTTYCKTRGLKAGTMCYDLCLRYPNACQSILGAWCAASPDNMREPLCSCDENNPQWVAIKKALCPDPAKCRVAKLQSQCFFMPCYTSEVGRAFSTAAGANCPPVSYTYQKCVQNLGGVNASQNSSVTANCFLNAVNDMKNDPAKLGFTDDNDADSNWVLYVSIGAAVAVVLFVLVLVIALNKK